MTPKTYAIQEKNKLVYNKNLKIALAGIPQLVGVLSCGPKGRRFNSQLGHIADGGSDPQLGCMRMEPLDVSLMLMFFLSLHFSLSKSNEKMSSGEDKKLN